MLTRIGNYYIFASRSHSLTLIGSLKRLPYEFHAIYNISSPFEQHLQRVNVLKGYLINTTSVAAKLVPSGYIQRSKSLYRLSPQSIDETIEKII